MIKITEKPKTISQILNSGFVLYRKSFLKIFPLSLLGSILIFAPHLFFDLGQPFQDQSESKLTLSPQFLLFCTFTWITSIFVLSTIIHAIYCVQHKIKAQITTNIKAALKNFLTLLMVGLLYALIVLCGIMLLIIPGIVLSITLMFGFIITITESNGILQNLVESHKLVWGHWWHTFFTISIPVLLNVALSLALFVSIFAILILNAAPIEHAHFLAFLGHTILQALFLPLIFAISLALIHDLKIRKIFEQYPQK